MSRSFNDVVFVCFAPLYVYCMCAVLVGEWGMCGCVRAGVINRHNCVWRSVCAFIFMKCYFRHLICHSLVNVRRSVSVDVRCHHPLPHSLSPSIPSLPTSLTLSSSILPPSALPPLPLFLHPLLGLITKRLRWNPTSSWRCPAQQRNISHGSAPLSTPALLQVMLKVCWRTGKVEM